jgi:hypothetical protein
MNREIQAWISAVAGACALSIAGLWYWVSWDDGLSIPPLPDGDMLDFRELFGLALLGVIFQFGTPALNVPAWILGLQARSHWAAKAGMAMAGVSLALYALYICFFVRLVTTR